MSADAGVLAPAGRAAPRPATLTRRASLNAAGALLDYGARIVVGLIVTPLLVHGLGRALFGVWEMLSRMGTWLTAADGRPTEALRLIVAQQQGSSDDAAKRRTVGATLVVWFITLPVMAIVGGAVAWWLSPALTRAEPGQLAAVRLTGLLIVASLLVTGLASVPESVLRGMNLGYRRMGLQAALNVLGGLLAAGAIWTGLGLSGLGLAMVLSAAVTGLCFWRLARRFVPWFGVARPARRDVRSLLGMSLWLAAGDVVAKILLSSDAVILGAVLAPSAVAGYALSGYAARTAAGIHVFTAGAAMPGIGGLLGDAKLARAARARRELLTLTWLFATVVGAAILLWNRSFMALWVGPEFYVGPAADVLIALAAVQTMFIRTDAWLLDAALMPQRRVMIGALAAALTISLGVVGAQQLGIVGLCLAVLVGRGVQSVAYPVLAHQQLGRAEGSGSLLRAVRRTAATAAVLTGATLLGQRLELSGWAAWATGVAVSLPLLGALALATTSADERHALALRLSALRAGRPTP